MKVLISPISLQEAEIVADAGTDILDIKNTKEGSLGAQFPWIIQEITNRFQSKGIVCSATLGDLPFKPGTAALASYGAAQCGVSYIKAGLHGVSTFEQALEMMQAIIKAAHMVNNSIIMVASGYADFRKFNGVHYKTVVDVAKQSGAQVAMLDTFYKDGSTLFDVMSMAELKEFTNYAHQKGLKVALAGSINGSHQKNIYTIAPDIIGVRGAVCSNQDRGKTIDRELLLEFLKAVHSQRVTKPYLKMNSTNVLTVKS